MLARKKTDSKKWFCTFLEEQPFVFNCLMLAVPANIAGCRIVHHQIKRNKSSYFVCR
jgi:hypothetical protein